MNFVLEIPDEVVAALRPSPDEIPSYVRRELALAPYQGGALPLSKAQDLSGITRQAFKQVLGQRGIDRHYGLKESQDDLATPPAYKMTGMIARSMILTSR